MTSETVECERLEVILALAKKSTLHFKLRQESPFASPYATSVFTWKAPDLKITERTMAVLDYVVILILKMYPGWFWAFLKMPDMYHPKCLFALLQVGIPPVVDHWAEYPGAWVKAQMGKTSDNENAKAGLLSGKLSLHVGIARFYTASNRWTITNAYQYAFLVHVHKCPWVLCVESGSLTLLWEVYFTTLSIFFAMFTSMFQGRKSSRILFP